MSVVDVVDTGVLMAAEQTVKMTVLKGFAVVISCGMLLVSGLPADTSSSCAKKSCTEENGVFAYETGKTYRYSYQTSIRADQTKDSQGIHHEVDLTADVTVLSPCNFKLTTALVGIRDHGTSPSEVKVENLRNTLQANDVEFAYYNGQVGEVCAPETESPLALNIKKGILSALQVSANRDKGFESGTFVEVDLAGECPTVYTVTNSTDGQYMIHKTRDSSLCTRPVHHTLTAYVGSDVKMPSLTMSRPNCEHVVRDGVLRSTMCVENHAFRPLGGYAASFTVHVAQQLTFLGTVTNPQPKLQGNSTEGDLTHVLLDTSMEMPQRTIPQLLNAICDSVSDDVRPETPTTFISLVHALRAEKHCQNLIETYQSVTSGSVCPKLTLEQRQRAFFDTIPAIATSCSVELMVHILKEKEYNVDDKDMWFASLAFIKTPEKQTIDNILEPLLRDTNVPRSGYMGISAYVQNYCRKNAGCDRSMLQTIRTEIMRRIDGTCSSVSEINVDEQAARLLALGNLNSSRTARDFLSRIIKCAKKPLPIRLAALQALRNRICEQNSPITHDLSQILSAESEDAECRIASMQRLMDCPSESVIKGIVALYENSSTHRQVKSYIYSFVNNIQSSSDSSLQNSRQLLSGVELDAPDVANWLRSSKHFEKAFTSTRANGTIDGNIVFADSSLPRSADIGVNIDLFGRKLDVIRLGGRQEGLESGLSLLTGHPVGSDKHVEFSSYLRLFGNDIALLTSRDVEDIFGNYATFDFIFGLTQEQPFHFSRNIMLLDTDYVIPSASGLPLNMKVTASAHAQLKGRGALNIGGMMSSEPGVRIQGEMYPSAAIQVNAAMTFNLHTTPTGFKTTTTLHTSTSLSGSVTYLPGQSLRTNIDLPKDKVEFVNFETKSFSIQGSEEQLVVDSSVPSVHRTLSECTTQLTSRMLGVELCMELESQDARNATILRNGLLPASFRTFLRKTDKGMRGYRFVMEYPQPKGGDYVQGFKVLFDTPGSRINRQFQLGYTYHYLSGIITGAAVSPWKKFMLDGQYRSVPMTFNATITEDDTRRHTIGFVLTTNIVDDYINFKPVLQYNSPVTGNVDISGDINQKFDNSALVVDMSFKSALATARMINNFEQQNQDHSVKTTLSYKFGQRTTTEEFLFNHQFKTLPGLNGLWKVATVDSLVSTEFPALNTKVDVDILRSPDAWTRLDTTTTIYRRNFDEERNKITVLAAYELTSQDDELYKLTANGAVKGGLIPENSMTYVQEWNPYQLWRNFDGILTLQCSGTAKTARLMWKDDFANLRMDAELSAASPAHHLTIRGVVRREDSLVPRTGKHPFEFSAQSSLFEPFFLTGEVDFNSTDVGVKLNVKRDTQSVLSFANVVTFRRYGVTSGSKYTFLHHSGEVSARVDDALDWSFVAKHDFNNVTWTGEVSIEQKMSNITGSPGLVATALVQRTRQKVAPLRFGGELGYFPMRTPFYNFDFYAFANGYVYEKSVKVSYNHSTDMGYRGNLRQMSDLTILTDFSSVMPKKTQFAFDVVIGMDINATVVFEYTSIRSNRYELMFSLMPPFYRPEFVNIIRLTSNHAVHPLLYSHWTAKIQDPKPWILNFKIDGMINGMLVRVGTVLDKIEVFAVIDINRSTNQIESKVVTTWNTRDPTQRIDVAFNGNYSNGNIEFASDLSITTPFENVRSVRIPVMIVRDQDSKRSMLGKVIHDNAVLVSVEAAGRSPLSDKLRYPDWASTPGITCMVNFTIEFPSTGLEPIIGTGKRSVNWDLYTDEFGVDFSNILGIENPLGFTFRHSPKITDLELRFLERSLYGKFFTGWNVISSGPQGFEILWDASRDLSKKISIIREPSGPAPFHEAWSFEHPIFPHRKSVALKLVEEAKGVAFLVLLNDQAVLKVLPLLDMRNKSFTAQLSIPQYQSNPYDLTARLIDDNHINVTLSGADAAKALLLYSVALENHQKLVQTARWNNSFVDEIKFTTFGYIRETWYFLTTFYRYSMMELMDVGRTFTENKAYAPVVEAASSLATSTLQRYRRMGYWPPSQCSGGQADSGQQAQPSQGCGGAGSPPSSSPSCGSGSSSGAQGCGSSSAFADSFASFTNQVNTQFQQMMQEMMTKLQQQSSQGHRFSSSVNVVSGGCGAPSQPQCSPVASPSTQQIQITLPSSRSSPSASQQQSYRQQSYSGYAAGGAASYSGSYGGPPAQPSGYAPSYSTPSQPQAQASQQVPSYAQPPQGAQMHAQSPHGGQPPQGAQMHAAQKSQQSQYNAAGSQNQAASYSHTIPMGDTRLTIQIYQQPAPAAPSPSTYSGSGQYQAAGSTNQESALSGQAQYGGRAEPRLQYCTPGSTEKGVCFHSGPDSLEPTRSKRSAPNSGATFTDYVLYYVGSVQDFFQAAWSSFLTQPEVVYLKDVSDRMSRYVTPKITTEMTQLARDTGKCVVVSLRDTISSPLVYFNLTDDFGTLRVTQQLPVPIVSLRKPVPMVLKNIGVMPKWMDY